MPRLFPWLTKPRGTTQWTGVVRASGLVAALAIPIALAVPAAGAIAGFLLVTIWLNGPISFVFPATYEPVLVAFGRLFSPWLIAAVGVGGTLYIEFLNYHLYRRLVTERRVEKLRVAKVSQCVTRLFLRAPLTTVWLCSTVLPYWPIRLVAPAAGYSVGRQLVATAAGRFPRLLLVAAIGGWTTFDLRYLLAVPAVAVVAAVSVWFYRKSGSASCQMW